MRGSTSCILIFYSSGYLSTTLEATLSMMLKTGLKPLSFKYIMLSLDVATIDFPFKSFTGVARMALNKTLHSAKMSVFLFIYLIGNCPVKSTYIVLSFGFSAA